MNYNKKHILLHLKDLRYVLIYSTISIVLCSIFCFYYSDIILEYLRIPIFRTWTNTSKFIVLAPYEYFFTKIKVSLLFGFSLSIPFIFIQLWMFISPGLHQKEKYYLSFFLFSGVLFFLFGILFCYEIVLPSIFYFFLNILPNNIENTYSINILFNFTINLLLIFGIIFETPIILVCLTIFNIVDMSKLKKSRQYLIIFAFIFGAIFTPPDPISQLLLAIPLILLFEFGFILIYIIEYLKNKN